ncbi:MAG: chemotaxis protein CheW, partial [Rhodospirillaceae bacterium]
RHFSFLYKAKAGRLLLMVEDVLDHVARGNIILTAELLALLRSTLKDITPAMGQPISDMDSSSVNATLAAFEEAIRAAALGAALAPIGAGAALAPIGAGAAPAPIGEGAAPATPAAGRQVLLDLGVTAELVKRLSASLVREVVEALSGGSRLWEVVAALEEAEERAERFATWLETNCQTLTSRAIPGAVALSFQFLVLTKLDDTAVLAALAGIDPDGLTLTARRCGQSAPALAPALVVDPTAVPSVLVDERGTGAVAASPGGNVLRVPGTVVDQFLVAIGEMVTVSGMLDDAVWGDDHRSHLPLDLRRLVKEMRAHGGADPVHLDALQKFTVGQGQRNRALRQVRDRLAATLGRLQESALELRVVPVETVFGRLPRLARDLAASQGKQVRVSVDGRNVRIDKSMVDHLLDPLIHMVRNAIDHGIETPAERLAVGKSAVATLSVCADQRDNRVVIEVTDDGRGLDAEAIRLRAVGRQLVGETTSRMLHESDLFRMILLPGFSTVDQVTSTSGRGVGMDVVHTGVTRLGGAIDIRSEIGRGATFTLRLPLSAAIQDVLLVEAEGRLNAIPVRHLLELCSARPGDIQMLHGQPVMLLHGALLPLYRLTDLLAGRGGDLPDGDLPIVVLGDGRRRLGLQVDRVVRRQELFVRDIHPRIAAIPGIGGAALLGDGKVVLIIDGGDLFQLAESRERSLLTTALVRPELMP